MKTTASDVLIDAIHDWGVDVVFGLPGDGINGIMEALRKRADKIRFVQVRHEEAAHLRCHRHRPREAVRLDDDIPLERLAHPEQSLVEF